MSLNKVGVFVKLLKTPAMYLIAKQTGLDFIFYDNEHSSFSQSELHDLILFGNAVCVPSFVRVPDLSKSWVSQTLDCGATAILVPMVETKEQAELLVQWSKYPPLGKRSYSGGANTEYAPSGNHRQNMDQINNRTLALVQIESQKGVAEISEILTVPGIDGVIIGPVDLSISLGNEGNVMDPCELAAIDHVLAECQAQKKHFGIIGNEELMHRYRDSLDYCITHIDMNLIRTGFADAVKTHRKIIE